MTDRDRRTNKFVADGCERAQRALEPVIRAEVEQQFAAELREASFWRRYWVRRKIEREIRQGVAAAAPPDALY